MPTARFCPPLDQDRPAPPFSMPPSALRSASACVPALADCTARQFLPRCSGDPVTQGLAVHPASRAALARSMPSRALAIAISRALMRPPLSRRARRRSSSEPISARITKAGTVGSSPRTTTSATREALSMQLPWRVSINSGRYKSEIEAKNAETRQPALPDVGCWYGGCLTKISVAAEAAPPRPSERGMVK
jgi:hypothetical protein